MLCFGCANGGSFVFSAQLNVAGWLPGCQALLAPGQLINGPGVHPSAIRTESVPESSSCIVFCVAVSRLRNAKVPLGAAESVYVQCCPYCHVWLCPCCHVWCTGGLLVFIIPGLSWSVWAGHRYGQLHFAICVNRRTCCVQLNLCACACMMLLFYHLHACSCDHLCRASTHMACFCGVCKLRPGLLPCPVRQL
jgi:hypothetical protein